MFVRIIKRETRDEYTYDCQRVGLHKVPGGSDDPPCRFLVLDVGGQDERKFEINEPCEVIYMNDAGKTIDRKIFETGVTVK